MELAKYLMAKYDIPIANVVRHYDVTGKNCPAPFVSDAGQWNNFKRKLEVADMTPEQINEMIDKALAERDSIVAQSNGKTSSWAQESWDKAVELGIFDGTRPGAPLTREQAAVVLDRLGLLEV